MGKTCAQMEKHKTYLNRIKSDASRHKEYRQKAVERMKKRRAELSKLPKKIKLQLQVEERLRLKKYREKKKNQPKPQLQSYNSKQTLGKAIKKAENALPKDLTKKVEIISALYKKYVESSNASKNTTQGSLEWQTKLKFAADFYLSEDISVQSANKKDTVIFDKEIVSKRFMILTVSEAYETYKKKVKEESVSKTVFFECRPKNVQLCSKMPHNMCVCIYHANFSFLLQGCAKLVKFFPTSFEGFLESACCNISDENCMANCCDNCTKDVLNDIVPVKYLSKMEDNVTWEHWRKVDDRIVLTSTVGPLSDLIHEIEVQLPLFKHHFFVKRAQQNYFEAVKKNIKPGILILQIDFAENYRLICQNEVQSAHFNYKQVSIFTCVAWMFDETKSFAIISDSLQHSKIDVYVFITKLVEDLKNHYGNFESIFFFSDGSSCQFKNKFIIRSLPDLLNQFGCKTIEWNYFATSHGKGAVDGIGAIVKRKIWQITKTKNIILNDAIAFSNCAQKHITGIQIVYVGLDTINEISPTLTEKWKDIPNIPGIRKFHSITFGTDLKLKVAITAYSSKKNIS